SPPNMAATAEGGVWYDEGSQKYSGNTADLMPKPMMKKMAVRSTRVRFCRAATLSDRSAMLRVPVMPYRMAMPVRKNVEARMFMAIYFTEPSICALRPPRVINTNEAMMMTSNQT